MVAVIPLARSNGSARPSSRAALVLPLLLGGALAAAACVPPPPPTTPPAPRPTPAPPTVPAGPWHCPAWSGVSAERVSDPAIREASGLVASRRNPGLWWTHNDGPGAGDIAAPDVYALDATGRTVGTLHLQGAADVDWEDIDIADLGGTPYLIVNDVGDNGTARASVQVYRTPEPVISAPGQVVTVTPEVINLVYPSGKAHNVEASFVDPADDALYLVTKEIPPVVFRVPAASLRNGTTVAVGPPVATLDVLDRNVSPAGKPTGADISADGSLLAMKTLDRTFLWHRLPGQDLAALLRAEPAGSCIYDDLADQQEGITPVPPDLGHGEALTPDGRRLATIAEGHSTPLQLFQVR
jgi:hypothetical protein